MLQRALWMLLVGVGLGSGALVPTPAAKQAPPPAAVIEPIAAQAAGYGPRAACP